MKLSKLLRTSLLVAVAAGVAYQLLAIAMLAGFGRKRGATMDRQDWPPVSILKPISGNNEQLRDNLSSFCVQDYPQYEVLMGFGDKNDEGIPISRDVARSFPVLARTVIEEGIPGANRKVANLIGLERHSRFDLLAISDSDMKVRPDYLKTIVSEYLKDGKTGLVTCPYLVRQPGSMGADFESLTIASDLFPAILVARRLEGMSFGLGASLLVSKAILQEAGGLSEIRDHLADDYQIGNRIHKKGHQVVLSDYIMDATIGAMTLNDYVRHQLRWAVTYRASRSKGYLAYGIAHVFPLALILSFFRSRCVLALPAGILVLRAALTQLVNAKFLGSTSRYKSLILLPFKDVLAFCIWLVSFFTKEVSWGSLRYTILKEGKMKEL